METNKREIASCSKEASSNPNFDRNKLEELLDAIISKTSGANMNLRIEVRGYTESAIKAKNIRISVERLDIASSKIPLRIQFNGLSEKWIVDIFLKKSLQANAFGFYEEVKISSKEFCEKDAAKRLTEKKPELPKPLPTPKATDADKDEESKKKRTRTSKVVTDKMILEILEDWMEYSKGGNKLHQTEFWKILSGLCLTINRLLILNLLVKKGLVRIIKIERRPQVEITPLGIALLEEQKKTLETKKLEKEKAEHLQKMLRFPGQSLSPLKKLQELRTAYARLEEARILKNEISKKLADLQIEIGKQEKQLSEMEARGRNCIKEIERLLSLVDPDKVAGLIEIAKGPSQ